MASRATTGVVAAIPLLQAAPVPDMATAVPLVTLLARFDRDTLEALAEASIAALDLIDEDSDLEDDDPAGVCDEDGINTGDGIAWVHGECPDGPGCPISDPGERSNEGRIGDYGEDQTQVAEAYRFTTGILIATRDGC